MVKKLSTFFLIFSFFVSLFILQKTSAYDDQTTHPALSEEIVDFYNLSFPGYQLTSQQKEWIIEGSILEDTPPRWINHFYDPIYKIGWSGEKIGALYPLVVKTFSFLALSQERPFSAVEWINNQAIQQKYGFYGGNRTWKKALEYYANGDEEQAYKTLGYVLHLLEDQSVPDHTRNDTHAHELQWATGDYGSPYEEYLKKYNRQKIKELSIPDNLRKENLLPVQKSSIEDYLISLAEYSNKYFFSKDTINDLKYQNPKIIRNDDNFGYGKDENGKEFPLARIVNIKTGKIFILDRNDEYIIEFYFSRLSRQAVIHGAGVINLFHKQGEDEKINKDYPAHIVRYDTSKITPPVFSVVGSGIKLVNGAKNLIAQVGSSVNNTFSYIGDLFFNSESADNGNIKEPEQNKNSQITFPINEQINNAIIESNENIGDLTENVENFVVSEKPALPPNFQNQLNDIENQANDLNNQVRLLATRQTNNSVYYNNQFIFVGGGGGSARASEEINTPVAAEIAAETPENEDFNFKQEFTPLAEESIQGNETQDNASSTLENATSTSETATSTDSTATSTQDIGILDSTATSAIILAEADHIAISEILFDAEGNDKGKEFIELYNPVDSDIDLSEWSLKYFRENSTSTKSLAVFGSKLEDKVIIPAKGFLLIGLNNYDVVNYNGVLEDILRVESLPNGNEETIVVLYDEKGSEIDRIIYDKDLISEAGQSLERLAWQNDKCTSAQGDGELLGNGCDTDNKNDFEIRVLPNPQNSSGLPEPRNILTEPQILISQLEESSSSLGHYKTYQEFGNGISGTLRSLEFKMFAATGDPCQSFYFQEFSDAGYTQLSREFSGAISDNNIEPDFIIRRADGSLWDYGTCSGYSGKLKIEFNGDIESVADKYYRLYFDTGDNSRRASFAGSSFDSGFGAFSGCNYDGVFVGSNGTVIRYDVCSNPNFDIYFILKGLKNEDILPIQQ